MTFRCILPNCNDTVTNSTIFLHFRSTIHCIEYQDIEMNEKISLMASTDENYLQYGKLVCLGVLGVKLKNLHGPGGDSIDVNQLEISIMATRNNYQLIYGHTTDAPNKLFDFITIWLTTTIPASSKIHASVAAYSEDKKHSLSSLIKLRDISKSQNVPEFMNDEIDFLKINSGVLANLVKDETLLIEIIIHENL